LQVFASKEHRTYSFTAASLASDC